MIDDERYRSFADVVTYDLFVKVYDPVRRRLQRRSVVDDGSTLFIHIPKNAGTSLFAAVGARNVGHRLFCDIPASEKRAAKRIVFCTRSPFERLASAWRYQQGMIRSKKRQFSLLGDLGDFADFALSQRLERLAAHHYFFRSQFRYLQGIERYADKLVHLRFEHLGQDVRDRLGLEVGHLNVSKNELPSDGNTGLHDRVRSIYRDDYEGLPKLLQDCGIPFAWDD